MRTGWIAVPFFLAWLAAGLAPAQDDQKAPEERLIEAELLELSTGDLEKAKAVYQAIESDGKAPEAVRARARLYLARCHRKLGQIEAAKRILEGLVGGQTKDREVLRQARGYLRELTTGRAENPEFDWLKELEKNPEIQARVFDLAMELVNPGKEAAYAASRQLVALGPLAVPVIERVIETSRDPGHRQLLAAVLLHSGRFERLSTALEAPLPRRSVIETALLSFQQSIPALQEEDRRRLIGALEKVPSSPRTDPFRDSLSLAAGDSASLSGKLARIEPLDRESGRFQDWIRDTLESLLSREPGAAAVLTERILDPKCPFHVRDMYFDLVSKASPERLQAPHWAAYLAVNPEQKRPRLEELEQRGAFDILAHLASLREKSIGNAVLSYFSQRYIRSGGMGIVGAPAAWAKVLRANPGSLLRQLAEANDEALPEYVGFLRNREKEAPEYQDNYEKAEPPSPRYVEAMAGLLDSKDPKTLYMAMDVISPAGPDTPQELFDKVEKFLGESEDLSVREIALYALLRRFQARSESGPQAARALLLEYERSAKGELMPEPPRPQPSSKSARAIRRMRSPSESPLTRLHRILAAPPFEEKTALSLYPYVLALAGSPAGAAFHAWYFCALEEESKKIVAPLFMDKLGTLKSRESRESAAHALTCSSVAHWGQEELPKVVGFLTEVANDPEISPLIRARAIFWPEGLALKGIHWARILGGEDSLAGRLMGEPHHPYALNLANPFPELFWSWVKNREEREKGLIYQAAVRSPQKFVRQAAIRAYPLDRPDAPEVFHAAVRDPETRSIARDRLKTATQAHWGPVFTELLAETDQGLRALAIDSLKRFGDPRSIQPLVKLLEDPDVEVRGKALDALRAIRQALEEKREWEKVVGGLEKQKKQDP